MCIRDSFYNAYSARCASIEADVFLVDGELYVAHKENEINKARKLRNLYLTPIREQFEMNGEMCIRDRDRDDTTFQLQLVLEEFDQRINHVSDQPRNKEGQ